METAFRTALQTELTERCRKNPSYSLRSFAKSLGIAPSALSQIMNGKRPITEKTKLRLGSALGINLSKFEKTSSRSESSRKPKQVMGLDQFAVISDWYHYAILELTHTRGFKSDSAWIARRLGLTKSEVNFAVERLARLKLLDVEANPWVDLSENGELTHLTKDMTSVAARKYQSQLLDLSRKSVQEVPLNKRNHTSATLTFDVNDMEAAVERIKDFRRSFARDFQPRGKGGEVYQIQISFFPLTKSGQE